MTVPAQQFPYVPRDPALGHASFAPVLPLTLTGTHEAVTSGLVDSGAAINVLPYSLGVQLGVDWADECLDLAFILILLRRPRRRASVGQTPLSPSVPYTKQGPYGWCSAPALPSRLPWSSGPARHQSPAANW